MTNIPQLSGLDMLMGQITEAVKSQIEAESASVLKDIRDEVKSLKKQVPTVYVNGKSKNQVTGLRHRSLDSLVMTVAAEHNVLMVGMAGTGKTKAAEQVSEALGLKFYCQSVGAQTSKSDLLGFMDANGKYVRSLFREAYEKGGLFAMDEIDAGNSNVLIVLNSALSNDLCSFPDKMVRRHKDFRFVATANTYGNGADRVYVGRNQLDAATLDRFTVIDWEVDEELETNLVVGYKAGLAWARAIQDLRKDTAGNKFRVIVSPRMTVKGAQLLEMGFRLDDVVKMAVLPQFPDDKRDRASRVVKDKYAAVGGKSVYRVSGASPKKSKAVSAEPEEGEVVAINPDGTSSVQPDDGAYSWDKGAVPF